MMMSIRFSGRIAAAVLLGLSGLAGRAGAQEAEVKLDQVPKAVMDAARAKFPGAEIREASKETEDGKTVFELEMTLAKRKVDATFQEDGILVVVEAEVPESEVPAAPLKAVKDKYPGAKIDLLVESVTKGPELKKQADSYEFHLTKADKTSAEVEVDGDGKILNTEEKAKD